MTKEDKIFMYSKWGKIHCIQGIVIIFRIWKKGRNEGIRKFLFL